MLENLLQMNKTISRKEGTILASFAKTILRTQPT
jgi:hypothetical protein